MRPKGTSEQLAEVRNRGLSMLEAGEKPKEVAEILKVTPRCVYRWRQEAKARKRRKTIRPRGQDRRNYRRNSFNDWKKRWIPGAYAFGYAEAITGRWTG